MSNKDFKYIKGLDLIAAVILFIGGINLGLVGFFGLNLVEYIFGSMSGITRIVYILVGISALYEAVMWKAIQRRWECSGFFRKAESPAV
jgi:uncharacterized membrane protein YuzA (DUF378 family)